MSFNMYMEKNLPIHATPTGLVLHHDPKDPQYRTGSFTYVYAVYTLTPPGGSEHCP